MCDVTAAVQGAQAVQQHQEERKRIDAENAAANANISSGREDYNYKNNANQKDFELNSRGVNQSKFDQVLATRAAIATAKTSAADSGTMGNSVDGLLASVMQKGARNVNRLDDDQTANELNYERTGYSNQKNMEQIIASNPLKAGPNPLGVVLGIGGAAGGYDNRSGGELSKKLGIA